MNDLRRLLKAVLERPCDLELRYIVADALEEAGRTARADFVRAQLRGEEAEPNELWLDGLDRKAKVEFVNGFLERVSCTMTWWNHYGCRAVSLHPITVVHFSTRKPVWSERESCFKWVEGACRTLQHVVPSWLFAHLKRPHAWYHYQEGAMADLSRAAVRWARLGIGLPEN